jgi:hypothetical protein
VPFYTTQITYSIIFELGETLIFKAERNIYQLHSNHSKNFVNSGLTKNSYRLLNTKNQRIIIRNLILMIKSKSKCKNSYMNEFFKTFSNITRNAMKNNTILLNP